MRTFFAQSSGAAALALGVLLFLPWISISCGGPSDGEPLDTVTGWDMIMDEQEDPDGMSRDEGLLSQPIAYLILIAPLLLFVNSRDLMSETWRTGKWWTNFFVAGGALLLLVFGLVLENDPDFIVKDDFSEAYLAYSYGDIIRASGWPGEPKEGADSGYAVTITLRKACLATFVLYGYVVFASLMGAMSGGARPRRWRPPPPIPPGPYK